MAGVVVTVSTLTVLAPLGPPLTAAFGRGVAAALWVVAAGIAAFALGGWAVGEAGGDPAVGPWTGLLVGASSLLLILALVGPYVGRAADLRSAGIALGLIDAPDIGTEVSAALDRLAAAETASAAPAERDVLVTAYGRIRDAAGYACSALLVFAVATAIGERGSAWRRTRPHQRRHTIIVTAAALGGMLAAMAGLTVWLWPSIDAVHGAVFDMDQSAGPEIGVNLTEVADHPEAMWGETVTISGRVDQILGPGALLLGNDKPIVGDKVLVVGTEPLANLILLDEAADAPLSEGDVAQVTGMVRSLATVAAGSAGEGLDTAPPADYEGRGVLVARSIDLDVPIAAAAGDKEFGAGSAGYDRGVTTDDVVYDPPAYLGQTVTVSDEVEEHLLTPHAFLLGDRGLLAVSAQPHPELFVEATAYVTGEVRRFHLRDIERDLGIDLDGGLLRPHEGEPVIVVRSLALVR